MPSTDMEIIFVDSLVRISLLEDGDQYVGLQALNEGLGASKIVEILDHVLKSEESTLVTLEVVESAMRLLNTCIQGQVFELPDYTNLVMDHLESAIQCQQERDEHTSSDSIV